GLRLILLNFFQWSEISRCDVGILWQRNQGREINPCSSFFLRKKHPFEHRIDRSDPMEFHVGGGTGQRHQLINQGLSDRWHGSRHFRRHVFRQRNASDRLQDEGNGILVTVFSKFVALQVKRVRSPDEQQQVLYRS